MTLLEASKTMLKDYKAEIRRNWVLAGKQGELDFTKLPIVVNMEEAIKTVEALSGELDAADHYKEWFKMNFNELISTYAALRPAMVFDAFCEMKYAERKEPLPYVPSFQER